MSTKSAFDELLEGVAATAEEFAKALPAGDEKEDENGEVTAEGEGEPDGDEDDAPMVKSFVMKDEESGEEREFVDASEFLKAIQSTIDAHAGLINGNKNAVVKVLGAQNDLIKSMGQRLTEMNAQIAALSQQGRGRKAVVTIAEPPQPKAEELVKSEQGQSMPPQEFMLKCDALFDAGKLTGRLYAETEQAINSGRQPPQAVVAMVAAEANA